MDKKQEGLNELLLQQIEKENNINIERNWNDEELRNTLLNKKEKTYKADKYRNTIIIIAIMTFIGGIILGNTFQVAVTKYSSEFNSQLMFTVWGSDLVFTLFMLLLCDILKTQEQIKEKLN